MIETLRSLAILIVALVRKQRELALENLARRQQLGALKRKKGVPRLLRKDRVFWVVLSRIWPAWRKALHLVKADTVVAWQRRGFQIYWARISRRKGRGRPKVSLEIKALIKQMATANPYWGGPRVHGELCKLGIEISERTVSRLMPKKLSAKMFPTADRVLAKHRSSCSRRTLSRLASGSALTAWRSPFM